MVDHGCLYLPRFFVLEELLPQSTFESLARSGKQARGWMAFDVRILAALDALRAHFGPLVANDWHTGGAFHARGLRVPGMPDYSLMSQHSFGRAVDLVSKNFSAEEMRAEILRNPETFSGISRIEMGVSWLHIDAGNARPIAQFWR